MVTTPSTPPSLTSPSSRHSALLGLRVGDRCQGCGGGGAGVGQEAVLTESRCRRATQSGTGTRLCSGHSGRCPSGCKGHTADTRGFLPSRGPWNCHGCARRHSPSPSRPSAGPSPPVSPALSLAKSPRLSRCSGKSTPTELFLMEPREAENRLRSKSRLRSIWKRRGARGALRSLMLSAHSHPQTHPERGSAGWRGRLFLRNTQSPRVHLCKRGERGKTRRKK